MRAAGVVAVGARSTTTPPSSTAQTGIPEHGITPESVGRLSGLEIDGGSPSDPAKTAAQRFEDALRKDGVSIGNSVTPGRSFPGGVQVADFASPTMADIVQDTNVPSNNYLAEMLLKDVGAQFGGSGSTAGGISVVRQFAAKQGARFNGENGSGLTRRNKASPASVVKLLDSMLEVDENTTPEEQRNQQRTARHLGQLAGRRRTQRHRRPNGCAGRRRAGNCHVKTGTLDGVSALSGYCFRGGEDADHAVIFSLLMNRVDVNRAHVVQDRMASLIARYPR